MARSEDGRRLLVVSAVSVALLVAAAGLILAGRGAEDPSHPWYAELLATFASAATVVVGALLVHRVPRNPYGRVWVWLGLATAATTCTGAYVHLGLEAGRPVPAVDVVALLGDHAWMATQTVIPFVLLRFPDGSPLGPRWRWPERATIGALVVVSATAWARTGDLGTAPVPSPLALGAPWGQAAVALTIAAVLVTFASVLAGVASLVVRYRRGTGLERQQLRWLTVGAAVLLASAWVDAPGAWDLLFEAATFSALPAAVAVAVLRYRLYELDRLISRTLSYALVLAVLAAVYAGAVLGLGGLARGVAGGAGGDVVVAASTLVAAAVARPVRRRVVDAVERRFDRSRYDARLTVERFGQRLRDQIDAGAIRSELVAAARATVRPSAVHLWRPTAPVLPAAHSTRPLDR